MPLRSAFAVALTAGAAASPQFSMLPARAFPGSHTVVIVKARVSCTLSIRYRNGRVQAFGTAYPRRGLDGWNWGVPADAATGPAAVLVVCSSGGRATRTVMIVGWRS